MKQLRLALLGFGNCGRAFVRMLNEKHSEILGKYDTDVIVTVIATASKGNIVDPDGIDTELALSDIEKYGRFKSFELKCIPTKEIVKSAEYDVLMEMTPLEIFTGQPATDHIRDAMLRGKHAITANKGPIAWHYGELKELAQKKGVGFFYETTVMDGTPIFNLYEHTLKMTRVSEVSGILNSTTNFVLEEMAKGCEYENIMRRGRELGFVEADPKMDIEGYDAAAKVTALLNVLMDADITPDMIDREGIENITLDDIRKATSEGKVIKLVCRGYRDANGKVIGKVSPERISDKDMLASIDSTTSVISITTDLMGKISIVEHVPEIRQTAYGVFSDMLRVIEVILAGWK